MSPHSMPPLKALLRYWFYPNPGQAAYGDTWVLVFLAICGGLIVLSIVLRAWRRNMGNPILRKLSKSWPMTSLWLGIAGAVLLVCRIEQIQFLAMRFLWLVWLVAALLYVVIQARLYRLRFYEVLPAARMEDPREKYLPKQKKR